MQVVEMAGGTVLAALVIYIAHIVTFLPARLSSVEQGQQQILSNQNRIENGMDAVRGELRTQDRRLTKLESQ